jgi:dTDP-4-dehydrorhamnose reductase
VLWRKPYGKNRMAAMTDRRVVVLGATGMLGHALIAGLREKFEVAGTVRGEKADAGRFPSLTGVKLYDGIDAERLDRIDAMLQSFRPTEVVNCIGVVKQLEEAKHAETAISINALFPHQLARLAGACGARLLHFSTDCVYSGTLGRPYTEQDTADARDLYGLTKYLGEAGGPAALTLRTSIIGRELRGGKGLIEWAIGQRGKKIKGYARALYSGFPTVEMARIVEMLIGRFPGLTGVWQVATDGISKYELLRQLNQAMHLGLDIEKDESFVCDRRLDGSRFASHTGYTVRPWPELVQMISADPGN